MAASAVKSVRLGIRLMKFYRLLPRPCPWPICTIQKTGCSMLARIPGAADRKYLLILTYLAAVPVGRAAVVSPNPPIEIAAPAGPFHVEGTRIIDALVDRASQLFKKRSE